jgi:aspartate/methionine/tyrosine aminotransferase
MFRFAARPRPSQDYTTICSSAPSQILAIAALEDRASLLRRSNAFAGAGRAAVSGVLDAHADKLGWGPGPAAGPVGWIRLERGSAAAYVAALLESDDGLLLLPSTVFDAGDAHVRAGFGRADSPALMAKWKATLDDADHPATAVLRA